MTAGRPDAPVAPPPLVGRERELAALRERLALALAGRGGLVLLGGEAGIGKTALAEALCHEAAARGALVLVGRCYDRTETPPYAPSSSSCMATRPRTACRPPRSRAGVGWARRGAGRCSTTNSSASSATWRTSAPSPCSSRTSTGPTTPRSTCCACSPAPWRRGQRSPSLPTAPTS